MFEVLLDKLQSGLRSTEVVIETHELLRNLVLGASLPVVDGRRSEPIGALTDECVRSLLGYLANLPRKLDWQVHDYSAAMMRVYAIYEEFVNDLASAYVAMLPELYRTAEELPEVIATNHRIGIGQILIKIGAAKQYREIDESRAIRALASGLGGNVRYALIPEAFLVERPNYRMEALGKIFGALGFEEVPRKLSEHIFIKEFIRATRGESDTAQSELDNFVKYRNESAHGTPDQILAPAEIKKIIRFILALGRSLVEIIEDSVRERHVALGNCIKVTTAEEVHFGGSVIVGRLSQISLKVGDELFISTPDRCLRVKVLSLQLEGADVEEVDAHEEREVGIRLSRRVRLGAELLRLAIPARPAPVEGGDGAGASHRDGPEAQPLA